MFVLISVGFCLYFREERGTIDDSAGVRESWSHGNNTEAGGSSRGFLLRLRGMELVWEGVLGQGERWRLRPRARGPKPFFESAPLRDGGGG
jgi:hypothetical protein